uniref:DUF4110 domain-containing protein n=1 Tax=Ananas comosus var. bracteatus TaxID=296719 RepID=A0A6V7Q2I0_ANACO|nr:unnamed protein product [Ananas comosus var. bracteatus]
MLAKCDDNGEKTLDMSTVKGEEKNLCKKDKYARIEQMRVTLGLSDYQRTPTPGETLGNFYRRTRMYWQMTAHKHTQHTGNELGKASFDLAKARYKEVKPILDELAIPEADQKAEEKAGTETSSRKKVNPPGTSSRRKRSSRKKVNQLETNSRKKAGAETSSRKEVKVNSAETSSQKKVGAEKSSRKKVNPAEMRF